MKLSHDESPAVQPIESDAILTACDEQTDQPLFGRFARIQHLLIPLAGIIIACIAFLLLRHLIHHISMEDIYQAIASMPMGKLAAALALTALSFAAVAIYDVVAVETVSPGKIPIRIAALTGAAGFAISNALGFALLTGGSLRYRIYASQGIPLADIGRIVGTSWLAIWLAFAVLVALALIVNPTGLPFASELYPAVEIIAGLVLILVLALFIAWLAGGEKELRIGKFSLRLPTSRAALVQLGAGLVDVLAAGGALYVLLPDSLAIGPAAFILIYVIALIIGIASHSPGGLGAFEATIIAGLGLGRDPNALAALLLYRLIYTLLPLIIATIGMVALELLQRRKQISKGMRQTTRILEPLIPPLAASVTFLGGIVLLVSGSTPSVIDRIDILSDFLPLPFIEISHLAASGVGLAMLVVARGLARRLERAWVAALLLFSLGALFSILKGLDWEEAVAMVVLSLVLLVFRDSFYRRPLSGNFALSWNWLASIMTIVLAALWVGFFTYRHVEYSNELLWEFAVEANAPRFLRVTFLLSIGLMLIALSIAINRRTRQREFPKIPQEVRDLVALSDQTSPALALLGDKRFLISEDGKAFIMYGHSGNSLISLGDPVGEPEAAAKLAWKFREMADEMAARTVFYEVGPSNLPLFLDLGLVALKIGEVARVDLERFTTSGSRYQPLRYAARRCDREGLDFEIIPQAQISSIMAELREISDEWLETKSAVEKGFSLGFFDEAYLANFDTAVLRQNGRIVAFANLWRSAGKNELTVDLMRYRPSAPAYIMDALFTKLLLAAQEQGYKWFNLGAAPLSGLSDSHLASTWHRFGSFLYRRGKEFYHFEGLKAFKEKFGPVWTPQYLICPPGLGTARALIDVTALINGNGLGLRRK